MADDVTQQILFKVAADTSAALSELQKLNEKNKEGSKSMVLSLADVKAGIDLITGAYGKAKDAIADFAKDARNEAAAAGFQIEGLRKSTQNLINDDDLLALAAKNATSQFRLTQKQLEDVGLAMIAVRNKGHDLHQVQANFADFLSTGNTKALREYGINVKEASRTHEGYAEGLGKLIDLSKDAGLTSERTGDAFLKSGIKLENSLDKLKDQLIQVAIHLAPIVSLVASLVDNIARGISLEEGINRSGAEAKGARSGIASALATQAADAKSTADQARHLESEALAREAFGGLEFAKKGFQAAFDAMPGRKGRKGGGLKGRVSDAAAIGDDTAGSPIGWTVPSKNFPGLNEVGINERGLGSDISGLGDSVVGAPGGPARQGFFGKNVLAPLKTELTDTAQLMRTFGQVGEEMFGTLKASALDAFTAIALGTDTVGGAFSKMFGAFLVGSGQKLLGIAIEETVLGFAALANPFTAFTAPLHFKTAGLAAVGATAAFGLARALGAGGGGSTAAALGGGGGGGGGAVAGLGGGGAGSRDRGGQNITFVVGNDFAEQSQNQRASKVRRTLEEARIAFDPRVTVLNG